ncbi:MAG: hypothetical protein L0271_20230 [Gemmatimonadetes bacterium]|nr:hypothetical protein [Gemmatimonadota bacterium]
MIDTTGLPTPLALAVRRLNVCGPDNSADTFLCGSYAAESVIKLLGCGLMAGLESKAADYAYRMSYTLVRADGLGTWESVIRESTTPPLAAYLPSSMTPLTAWAAKNRIKPEDDWFRGATEHLSAVFQLLELDSPVPQRKPTARDLLGAFVQLRNKTKAHGAVGQAFLPLPMLRTSKPCDC